MSGKNYMKSTKRSISFLNQFTNGLYKKWKRILKKSIYSSPQTRAPQKIAQQSHCFPKILSTTPAFAAKLLPPAMLVTTRSSSKTGRKCLDTRLKLFQSPVHLPASNTSATSLPNKGSQNTTLPLRASQI